MRRGTLPSTPGDVTQRFCKAEGLELVIRVLEETGRRWTQSMHDAFIRVVTKMVGSAKNEP